MGSLNPDAEMKQEFNDSGYIQDDSALKAPVGEHKVEADGYKGTAELLDLSDDVLLYILRECSPQDLKALGFTCPRLGSLVLDRSLWVDVECSAPLGRRRVRWLLMRALGPHTRRLKLRGYAREAHGCLGFVNRYDIPESGAEGASGEPHEGREDERHLFGGPRVFRLGPSLLRYGGGYPYWPTSTPASTTASTTASTSASTTATTAAAPPVTSCPGPQLTLTNTSLRGLTSLCSGLRTLELVDCVIDCQTTNIAMFPKTLTKLSLRGTKCFNLEAKSFLFKIQDYLTDLEELDVSHCSWIEPACMLPLSKMPRLRSLAMRHCPKLAEFVAYASLATRYGFKELKILDLSGSPVGDSEVSALGWLPNLEELHLSPSPAQPRVKEHAHYSQDLLPALKELDEWEENEPDYFKSLSVTEDEEWLREEEAAGENRTRNCATSSDPSRCILLQRMVAAPVIPEEYDQVYQQFLAGYHSNVQLANPQEYREAYQHYLARPNQRHPLTGYSLLIHRLGEERRRSEASAGTSKRRVSEEAGTSGAARTSSSNKVGASAQSGPSKLKEVSASGQTEASRLNEAGVSAQTGASSVNEAGTSGQAGASSSNEVGASCQAGASSLNKARASGKARASNLNKAGASAQARTSNLNEVGASGHAVTSKIDEDEASGDLKSNEAEISKLDESEPLEMDEAGPSGLNLRLSSGDKEESGCSRADEEMPLEAAGPLEVNEAGPSGAVKGPMKMNKSADDERPGTSTEKPGSTGGDVKPKRSSKRQANDPDTSRPSDPPKNNDSDSSDDDCPRPKRSKKPEQKTNKKRDNSIEETDRIINDIRVKTLFEHVRLLRARRPSRRIFEISLNAVNAHAQELDSIRDSIDREFESYINHNEDNAANEVNRPNDEVNRPNDEVNRPNDEVNRPNDEVNRPNDEVNRPNDEVNRPNNQVNGANNEVNMANNEVNMANNEVNMVNNEVNRMYNEINRNEENARNHRLFQYRSSRIPIFEDLVNARIQQRAVPRRLHPGVLFSGAPPPGLGGLTRLDHSALVTDSSIRRFGRAIGENINYINIGGGEREVSARPDRSSLRVLSVTGFRHITDASLMHLATAAPELRQLDVSGTAVTQQAIERFRIMRPDVEVISNVTQPNPDSAT